MEILAIVNVVNGSLVYGAGVVGVIVRVVSFLMEKECDVYIKKYGLMFIGEIMYIRAGGQLFSKVIYILYVVGFIWLDNLSDRCMYELIFIYVNFFKYVNKLWILFIVLLCISLGIQFYICFGKEKEGEWGDFRSLLYFNIMKLLDIKWIYGGGGQKLFNFN